jgi:hypothetical protein
MLSSVFKDLVNVIVTIFLVFFHLVFTLFFIVIIIFIFPFEVMGHLEVIHHHFVLLHVLHKFLNITMVLVFLKKAFFITIVTFNSGFLVKVLFSFFV